MINRTTYLLAFLATLGLTGISTAAAPGELLQSFQAPTPVDGDCFGSCIAAVGNNLLVGAPALKVGVEKLSGAAYLFDGSTGKLLRTFRKPTPACQDHFGICLAAIGKHVLIGAPGPYGPRGPEFVRAVYLFDGSTGKLLQTFRNPRPAQDDRFAFSVAAAGDNVVVGAYLDDTGAPNAGAAYLFDRSTGKLLHTFHNPTPATDDHFGWSVGVVGNNVLVGAPADDTGAEGAGAVYLFDGTTGKLLRTLQKATPVARDYFGAPLAAMGNNVLVGVSGDDTGGENAGSIYLFDGTTGEILRVFLEPAPGGNNSFGASFAVVGKYLLVGAPYADRFAENAGAAYLFDGTTGKLLRTFQNPTPDRRNAFGYRVAAMGNTVAIGEFNRKRAGATVHLFKGIPQPAPADAD